MIPELPERPLDVVGIGNALVDVISHGDEAFLVANDLPKGSMNLVDGERAESIYGRLGPAVEASGGSARANTMAGVASFGGRAAYIGKVATDQLGDVFRHDLRAAGVDFDCPGTSGGPPTGRCLIVVTPDAQRTMCTHLGVSELLGPDDVDVDVVAAGKVTYLEGYLWDRAPAMAAYQRAAAAAHAAGGWVALTLSDSFCVERHRDAFLELVTDEVDLLFANEAEICALYRTERFDEAVERVRADCAVAALTRGPHGSLVVAGDEAHRIEVSPVDHVVDTTGAGDQYAAGFLYGFTRGIDLAACGRLGSMAASEVLSHDGPRPAAPLAGVARAAGLLLDS